MPRTTGLARTRVLCPSSHIYHAWNMAQETEMKRRLLLSKPDRLLDGYRQFLRQGLVCLVGREVEAVETVGVIRVLDVSLEGR